MTSPTPTATPAESHTDSKSYRPGPIRTIILVVGLLCVISLGIDAARDADYLQVVILAIPAGVIGWALIPHRPPHSRR